MLMGDQFAAEECVTLVSPSLRTIAVSYTHLDVYKRQVLIVRGLDQAFTK